jgi:DNA-binding beta-propeller fold protein YncE
MFYKPAFGRLRAGSLPALPLLLCACLLASPLAAQKSTREPARAPALELAGGRRLEFVRTISIGQQAQPKRSLVSRLVDWIAGPAPQRAMVRPYGVALDSRGRVLVTDPGAGLVHCFDFEQQKYSLLSPGKGRAWQSPLGIAVDRADNIYVSDSQQRLVVVLSPQGKFQRTIGTPGGSGLFARPTGLAIDHQANLLYVVDTLRHRVNVLDLQGRLLRAFGHRGLRSGEFNFPTEIAVRGEEVIVLDALNFRVQTFTRQGQFVRSFGELGERPGRLFRPKGLALDSAGNIYLADGLMEVVQVFSPAGRLLYSFGRSGTGAGEFQLPAGLFIDPRNRVYVTDSLNRRVQVFQFRGPASLEPVGGRP